MLARRFLAVGAFAFVASAIACSAELTPQPLPPATGDGTGADASVTTDGGAFMSPDGSHGESDAAADAGAEDGGGPFPPPGDAAVDGGPSDAEAGVDASDASDAALDVDLGDVRDLDVAVGD
jgi:hypothetical protein